MSDVHSAEKLDLLRSVAGTTLPDSKLRSALIRSAGDLNLAASRLLCENSHTPSSSTARPPQPPPSASARSAAQSKTGLPGARKKTHSHLRRLAWRTFYCQQYERAVSKVGSERNAVDAHIVALWKNLGSRGREAYMSEIQRQVDEEAKKDAPEQPLTPKATNASKSHLNCATENVNTNAPSSAHTGPSASDEAHIHNPAARAGEKQSTTTEPSKSSPSGLPTAKSSSTKTGFDSPHKSQLDDDRKDSQTKTCPYEQLKCEQRDLVTHTNPLTSHPIELQRAHQWPRELVTRNCRGIMLTRGKKLLKVGHKLELSVPPLRAGKPREKKEPVRLVRFSLRGREMGRLAPDLAYALAPGLQSGFILGFAKVLWAPPEIRMFTDVDLEVSVFIKKEAFEGNKDVVEAGLDGDGEGIDAKRVNVVSMISALKLCQKSGAEIAPADRVIVDKSLNAEDPGAVDEGAVESYYKTVEKISEQEASKYKPPRSLSCTLREYQRIGVLWMTAQEKHGRSVRNSAPDLINPLWRKCAFPDGGVFYMNTTTGCLSLDSPIEINGGPYGGILADEMGLGKTVQCIACILHDIEEQMSESKVVHQKENNALSTGAVEGSLGRSERSSLVPQDKRTVSPIYEPSSGMEVEMLHEDDHIKALKPTEEVAQRPFREGDTHMSTKLNRECIINNDSKLRSPRRASLRSRAMQAKRTRRENSENSEPGIDGLTKGSEMECIGDPSEKDEEESKNFASSDDDWMDMKERASQPRRKRRKKVGQAPSAISKLMATAVKKASCGGTLIVCPTSLVTQWMNQLDLHVIPNFLRVTTHYGQGRGDARSISLLGADVVVTSYGTLAAECSEDTSIGENICPRDGPLFQLQWRRIILDEAHTIKSRVTKWAKASYKIKAERRWCVTGTVIHNHVNDVFSLLHFLDLKPWSSWAFWNRLIVSNLESSKIEHQRTAMSLIRDIISSVTLRRKKTTKDSRGQSIVQLTKKTVTLVELTPSSQERDFYSAIHQRSKLQFDTYLAEDKVMNNYASVLELLLRLRQACDHPYLVFAAAPSKDSVVMKDRDKLFKQFMDAGSSAEYVEKVFKDAQSGEMGKTSQCPLCLDVIDDPVAPKECGHPACRMCMTESLKRANKCPVCRIPISRESVVTLPRKNRFSVDLSKKWRSSAKIDELLKDVRIRQTLRDESKGKGVGKTVIFSQFTSMLDLVGTALDRENFHWLRIDGSVPQAQRALILERFENENELSKDSSNILLVSLRAGGVGLNLVTASFAILLDIHWNPQVDAQAQDRIHRHGQTRDVTVKRYIIKDSVEEQLLKVQSRKQNLADGALEVATDEDRKKVRLSELKLLFSTS
ncbi:unnamed protein product [Agarophyton chilense]